MKDKNGREIKHGDTLRLADGTEVGYEFDDRPGETQPHHIGLPFGKWFTDAQAAIVLYGCEVVAPLEFEEKVITYSVRPGESFDCILVPAHSGIKPGDTVVVRVKK